MAKENQQYRLCLQYEYIGFRAGKKVVEEGLESFNKILPMGYTAEDDRNGGHGEEGQCTICIILIVIAIIFFTTSICFNSLKQPLAIIFVIPISYIGVFLTFYLLA